MDGSGAGTTMNTEIAIINDNIVEEAETIILTASVSSALTARFVTGGEMATISITNDDCEYKKCVCLGEGSGVEWVGEGEIG